MPVLSGKAHTQIGKKMLERFERRREGKGLVPPRKNR